MGQLHFVEKPEITAVRLEKQRPELLNCRINRMNIHTEFVGPIFKFNGFLPDAPQFLAEFLGLDPLLRDSRKLFVPGLRGKQ